jgi:hypothetical protein
VLSVPGSYDVSHVVLIRYHNVFDKNHFLILLGYLTTKWDMRLGLLNRSLLDQSSGADWIKVKKQAKAGW